MKEMITKNYKIFYVIVTIVLMLISFGAGTKVGFRRSEFSGRWGETYFRKNFGEPKRPMRSNSFLDMGAMKKNDFINPGSVIGKVVSLSSEKGITVAVKDGTERVVVLGDNTIVRKFRENIKLEDIKIGDNVVVFGAPNEEGYLEANLIRLVPFPFEENNENR